MNSTQRTLNIVIPFIFKGKKQGGRNTLLSVFSPTSDGYLYIKKYVYFLISMVILCYFLSINSFLINGSPSINNVCQDEWNEETYVEHSLECELT